MADDFSSAEEWINRAKSNLIIATSFDINNLPEGLYLEDLCFDLQQCTKKSLKAILVKYKYDFPRTHDIPLLVKLIKENTTIDIPSQIEEAKKLNSYTVKSRYPNWNRISANEYNEALAIAKKTLMWASSLVK